jgi:hypothetical protein
VALVLALLLAEAVGALVLLGVMLIPPVEVMAEMAALGLYLLLQEHQFNTLVAVGQGRVIPVHWVD